MNARTTFIEGISKDKRGVSFNLDSLTLLKEQSKWEALPSLSEAVDTVKSQIESEDRKTETVNAKHLILGHQGNLNLRTGDKFTVNGFKKFMSTLASKGASFLLELDPDIRSVVINRLLSKRELDLKFHTREDLTGGREIYSVTGPSFPEDNTSEHLLTKIEEQAFEGCKGVWSYDPNKATVTLETLFKNFDTGNYTVGDPHQGGIKWQIRDAGYGSIQPSFVVYRHKCANMQLLRSQDFKLARTIHRGSMDKMNEHLSATFKESKHMLDTFYLHWGIADKNWQLPGVGYATRYMQGLMGASSRASGCSKYSTTMPKWEYLDGMYGALLTKYPDLVLEGNVKKSIEAYSTGFHEEPEFNWRGLLNGITAVARGYNDTSAKKAAIESVAGDILTSLVA